MALTAEQKEQIAKIIPTTTTLLDAHLTSLGATFTADKETSVEVELDRWDESGAKFTKLHPKESNYGAETFPDAVKSDIRRNIMAALEWPYATAMPGMGTLQIV